MLIYPIIICYCIIQFSKKEVDISWNFNKNSRKCAFPADTAPYPLFFVPTRRKADKKYHRPDKGSVVILFSKS